MYNKRSHEIASTDPFNLFIDKILLTNYVNDHQKKIYSKIKETRLSNMEKIIEKVNKKRNEKKINLGDKFTNPVKEKNVDPLKKTISADAYAKVHMGNIKRTLRNRYSFDN